MIYLIPYLEKLSFTEQNFFPLCHKPVMDTNTDISKEKDWLSGNAKKLQLHADEKLKNGFWTFLLQLALSDESPLQVLMWRENPTQLSLLERMERCIWKSNKPRHFFLNSLCLILSLCVNQGPKWVDSFEKTLQQNKDHFFSLCGDLCQSLDFFFEEGICFGETSKITLSEKQRDKLFDGMRKRLRERNSLQAIQSVAKESFLKLLDNSARQMMLRILLYVSKVGGVDEHTIEVIQPLFRKTANDEVVKYIVQANNQLHGQESNRACFCFLIKEQQKKVRFRLPSDFRYCKRAKPSQQTTSSTLTTITGQSFNSNRDPRYSPNYNPHYHPPDPYYYPPDPYYHPPDPHYHPPDRYTIYSPHYYPSQPSTFYRLRSFIHRKIREPEDTQFSLEAPEQKYNNDCE